MFLTKQLIEFIPSNYDYYLEPFVGGGSVYFYLEPKKSILTDVHPELIDFYNSIKKKKSMEIYNFMLQHPNNEKIYYEIRDNMINDTELENAKRFFYLRKTCFRGMLRYNKNGKFNIPFGRYKTCNFEILKDKKYEELLTTAQISCNSYQYIFENFNDERNFMFLDPPYDSEFTDYGYCKFNKENHKELANFFKTTNIKCLMVIGKTQFISELYHGYIIKEYEKKYKFKLHSGRIGNEINTTHLVIKNY